MSLFGNLWLTFVRAIYSLIGCLYDMRIFVYDTLTVARFLVTKEQYGCGS